MFTPVSTLGSGKPGMPNGLRRSAIQRSEAGRRRPRMKPRQRAMIRGRAQLSGMCVWVGELYKGQGVPGPPKGLAREIRERRQTFGLGFDILKKLENEERGW